MNGRTVVVISVFLAIIAGDACSRKPSGVQNSSFNAGNLRRIGTVDERYQSYNVEMIEVTGGRFWKPYKDIEARPDAKEAGATGIDPGLYQQRPPTDLANPRLTKLAAALKPAYMRVSGTWANTTYFHDSDRPAPSTPPSGFNGVLTRAQWKGLIDFANSVGARLVTSFATSAGTRDAKGVWTPKEAQKIIAYTKANGGNIAAAEFMNEPTFASLAGVPKGYDGAAYARDLKVFRPFIKGVLPDMVLLGPGSVAEGVQLGDPSRTARLGFIKSEDLLASVGPIFDAFSYHFYGAVSKRCGGSGATTIMPSDALSEDWLSRTDKVEEFYKELRDRFQPGKPLWLTETADAACGGNPWGSTFLDSFRYLDQLGRLAKKGVQVVAHNTLAASDYGLLDENTLTPRPNYWAALLWHKRMGSTVLDASTLAAPALHVYAHCSPAKKGAVALLVINTDRTSAQSVDFPSAAERYALTADDLEGKTVRLNGRELEVGADDTLPEFTSTHIDPGRVVFEPASITFLDIPDANNASCR